MSYREDHGYEHFINFLRKEGFRYSCFPKLYYADTWGEQKVYLIEKLETLTDDNHEDRVALSGWLDSQCTREHIKSRRRLNKPRLYNFSDDFINGVNALMDYFRKTNEADQPCFDFHSGNVTFRGNDPVIIDPFS